MDREPQPVLENVWIRFILISVSIVLFLFLCYVLRGPLVSLLLAFMVAYIFNPVVNLIERLRWPFSRKHIQRGFGIVFLMMGILLFTSGFLAYVIPKTTQEFYRLGGIVKERYPAYLEITKGLIEKYGSREMVQLIRPVVEEVEEQLEKEEAAERGEQESLEGAKPLAAEGQERAEPFLAPEKKVKDELEFRWKRLAEIIDKYKKYVPRVIDFFFNIIKNVFYGTFGFFSIAVNFIIFSVVSVYLLKDFNALTKKVKDIFPLPVRNKVVDILKKINHNLQFYLRGQMITCLILSFIYSIGLTIAGVDLAFLVGFIGGFGNLIPYVGTGIGIFLGSVVALFEYRDFAHILYVIITFSIGQTLEATVITPRIMKRELLLHPAIVILAILIFGQLWGFLGLLLAIPITAILRVLVAELISLYKSSRYYTG
ncbi:MAG: AI-2E family transporter [wastewater metagenome]|nr:AI-2E family transporter [Candidatus Loosdrechtia aerotolerans]